MGNTSSKRSEQLNTTPTGLYEHCEWDPKVVRRLILERKLAPISVGKEETSEEGLEECPICFLYYSGGLNRSRCCRKGACTECYLQVKRPNQTLLCCSSMTQARCPFCNHAQYIVTFSGPLSREEIVQEQQEQQKVQELKTIMRNEEIERDKQRMLEKEQLRKEQEQNGVIVNSIHTPTSTPTSTQATTGNTVPTPVRHATVYDNPRTPHSVPSNPHHPPFGTFGQYYGSSYPPPSGAQHSFAGDDTLAEAELDDLMLMEAIRLSLLDAQISPEKPPTSAPNPPPSRDSNDSEDSYNSDDSDDTLNPTTTVPIVTNINKTTSKIATTDTTLANTTTIAKATNVTTTNFQASLDQDLVDYPMDFQSQNSQAIQAHQASHLQEPPAIQDSQNSQAHQTLQDQYSQNLTSDFDYVNSKNPINSTSADSITSQSLIPQGSINPNCIGIPEPSTSASTSTPSPSMSPSQSLTPSTSNEDVSVDTVVTPCTTT